jgi:hypothetical protein
MGMNLAEAKLQAKRPSLRTTLIKLTAISACYAAALVLDKFFNLGWIAFGAYFVLAFAYVAWYFLRYWHSMGWLSLPKRRRSY